MKSPRHPLRRRHRSARMAGTALVLLCELSLPVSQVSARDILRGGGGPGGAPPGTTNPVGTTPPPVAPTGGTTRDSLARTAQAIQAAQAMQDAARNLANGGPNHAGSNPSGKGGVLPDVPDGLGTGGLQVDPRVAGGDASLWKGADLPVQTTNTGGGVQVTVKQTAQQALLNWETFNVGKNTTLKFDQSAGGSNVGQWIAFNKVNDPTGNPTQILGSIQAPGQVYIINRNGIVFGGSSQVNTHTLVASALPINTNLIDRGLLNNPDQQFLFSALKQAAGPNGTPAFDPEVSADTRIGDVIVEKGAKLTAPTSPEKIGGRIALVGANVSNQGTISTVDGQTILAAGLQVGFAAHKTTDPSLRGLDTFIGAVVDPASTLSAYAGSVTNSGIIDAGRASVTMAGKAVNQLGIIASTTSVSFNGRIDLLADYDALANIAYNSSNAESSPWLNRSSGTVTLGENSVTQILPEWASTDKVVGSTLALPSQVNIRGKQVHFDDNSTLLAPSANVTVSAGSWFTIPAASASATPTYSYIRSGGRIDLDAGAVIDVSGSKDVASSVSSNIVKVELRGTELANSPLNKDGALRGETIYVDITKTGTYDGKTWIGTPLADVSGYANLVQRTVGELTAAGGTVKLDAGDAVVIRSGAVVDVSGGWVNYASGGVQTSRVIADGRIFDVSEATPDRIYDGVYSGGSVYTSGKWGTTEQYTNPIPLNGTVYQEGFTQGGAGGTLQIAASSMALDGRMAGSTFAGVRQREVRPAASTLDLSFTAERVLNGAVSEFSPNAPTVTFRQNAAQALLADFATDAQGNAEPLPPERLQQVTLSPDLIGAGGFDSLVIDNPDGDIIVPEQVTLAASPRGSIKLAGANLDIAGSVIAAGGSLSFTAYDISPSKAAELRLDPNANLPAVDPDRGHFTLGPKATLNTAGWIVDDRPQAGGVRTTPQITTGGTISIAAMSADLQAGSVIDVSGGVYASGAGKITYGNAGSLSILSGRDITLAGVVGGRLSLGGELRGYSGAKGGSLTVQAAAVQIGGSSTPDGVLQLAPGFFDQGGFSTFTVQGVGLENGSGGAIPGLTIAAGVKISPVVSSWLAADDGSGHLALSTYLKPEGLRSPLSLNFAALGSTDEFNGNLLKARGDLFMGAGAVVDAGPAGAISLKGDTVEVHGSLLAAGGSIQVTGANRLPTTADPVAAGVTVLLGSDAVLDASGTTVLVPDSFGRRRGAVLDGGSIRVAGNVVAEKGAVLDVSGSRGTLDLLPGEAGNSLADLQTGASGTVSTPYPTRGQAFTVESNAGKITLSGGQMLFSDATLLGEAGGKTAAGGTLQVSSGRFYLSSEFPSLIDPTLLVKQSGDVLPASYQASIGANAPVDGGGIPGGGRFSVEDFTQGGFSNLDLSGTVKFSGPVSIQAAGRITAGTNPVLYADSSLSLTASYVALGYAFQKPLNPADNPELFQSTVNGVTSVLRMPPVHGEGSLSVNAGLIDVGHLSLQGIGRADLVAANGDIRGNGTLAVAGDLSLTAGQIYPPTGLDFTLAAFDYTQGGVSHAGSITIGASGVRRLPLSAGGTLSLYASSIHQNGVLRAPFGKIQLGWDGTGTAPVDRLTGLTYAKTKDLTLGASSVTSVSAIDPVTGQGVTIPYGVSLDGTAWIDPRGVDITASGAPQKSVRLSAESVVTEEGSEIDIRGGGDLLAYRWVEGTGGTEDVLASSGAFAVIPGYDASYAPYAPFNGATSLGGDPGYVNSTLQIGQQVRLDGGGGLPAGVYTLLPARYALLPGAYLVKPLAGAAVGQVAQADGSSIVSGYRFNGLEAGLEVPSLATRFEVASTKTVDRRAEYTRLLANKFLTTTGGLRLPGDSGQLVLAATQAMAIGGEVRSAAPKDYRGGLIDISSPVDIHISNGGGTAEPGSLVLDAGLLSSFGAESLLIGGVRETTAAGTEVTVTTGKLTLDNAGSPLSGAEIILTANQELTLAPGAEIRQTGSGSLQGDPLILGKSSVAGSGNGALVRVGSDPDAPVTRRSVTAGGTPRLSVGAGATISGTGVTLDSTSLTLLDPTAVLDADALSISSGRISLSLDPAVTPGADAGLVLSGETLEALSASGALALASYSSIDLLGTGTIGGLNASGRPRIDTLALRAAEIRGIGTGTGAVTFQARQILLDNQPGGTASTAAVGNAGRLSFQADTVQLGAGALAIRGFAETQLSASKELRTVAGGSLTTTGDLALTTPLVDSAQAVKYAIASQGRLSLTSPGAAGTISSAGLGASLSLTGASVDLASRIVMPSGEVIARATSGDLQVSGSIETGGIAQRFKDQLRYTDGGHIRLVADQGDVTLAAGGSLDVSARPAGGDAGSLEISAVQGGVNLAGSLFGAGGAQGDSGSFSLDVGSLPTLAALDAQLNAASFDQSRSYRVRHGDVRIDGIAQAHDYSLSTDEGSIALSGTLDASGTHGGSVRLVAASGLTLESGSLIDVSATDFDAAGKGGSVTLETRGANGGKLELAGGSKIDLSVDTATSASAAAGKFTGTLHLRAPQIDGGADLAVGSLASQVTGASHIIVEGYKTYDLSSTGGAISTAVQTSVKTDATSFIDHAAAIENRILAAQGGAAGSLGSLLTVRPGAEIVNATGDLVLGTATSSGATGDWNLATFRFGAEQVPGILTLRAAGNLIFNNSLSDGFTSGAYTSGLLANNAALPDHVESWSYRLVAGADFSAADTRQVKSLDNLGADVGSLKLGKNIYSAIVSGGNNALTSTLLSPTSASGAFQVIRTGSGDIDVVAGRDIQLLNTFASIYTAGTLVSDPTLGGTFDIPRPSLTGSLLGSLGAIQQNPAAPVQYTLGGGNVDLYAGNDIIHLTRDSADHLIADSYRGMPTNWLYRRGYVDPETGEFGKSRYGETASTSWWVDFTNFFEGVGALGGGNVTLTAGRDVSNVDAVAPTNARMAKGAPGSSSLVELGGGDVTVHAGRNIDGGVYYVERGQGDLLAGGSIVTNSTRSPSLTILRNPSQVLDSSTWLATTLFAGKASFEVQAAGDLLLGPTANPFLLPQGYNNTFWYKTYFSTYDEDSSLDVSSLGGSITFRTGTASATNTLSVSTLPSLQSWFQSQLRLTTTSAANSQPWLRLAESNVTPFATAFGLMPGTLRATAFSGDINLAGNLTLSPSATGTLELLAGGGINGLQVTGVTTSGSQSYKVWNSSTLNLSDADPSRIPGVASPFAYQNLVGTANTANATQNNFLSVLDVLFAETGSTDGVLEQKQVLHSTIPLHRGDAEPVRLYSEADDISGLTLFSGKAARVLAGQDLRDVSLYLQHVSAGDLSVVSAGRDILLYDATTPELVLARSAGNLLGTSQGPTAGDIQIAGPGTLEVLAGRDLDLGIGANRSDGTGTGITSIGNGRNPYLGFEGAEIIAAAGIGESGSLDSSRADFTAFIARFVRDGDGTAHLKELGLTPAQFDALDSEQQKQVALQVFYFVLRDTGRDHNDPEAEGFGTYDAGKEAIATLFPGEDWDGDIRTQARDIRTRSGGDITLFAPGGSLTLASTVIGSPLAPPGIITEAGGNINIFADSDVNLGISRIFTLRGGDEIIWSTHGDIAAGSSSKTVQSAPPTRVLIDPQSADVKTDLAGLATGGGIGVLTSVAGVAPSDVDLIAPEGTIDAGDAGIRVSGNLNLAAAVVVNTSNISVGGASTGASGNTVAAPSVSSLTAASTASAAAGATEPAPGSRDAGAAAAETADTPSLITVDVLGYGGGDDDEEEKDKDKDKKSAETP